MYPQTMARKECANFIDGICDGIDLDETKEITNRVARFFKRRKIRISQRMRFLISHELPSRNKQCVLYDRKNKKRCSYFEEVVLPLLDVTVDPKLHKEFAEAKKLYYKGVAKAEGLKGDNLLKDLMGRKPEDLCPDCKKEPRPKHKHRCPACAKKQRQKLGRKRTSRLRTNKPDQV